MIIRTNITHHFVKNKDKEILDSIIHFLTWSDYEYSFYGSFDVPSLNKMVDVLFENGYNDGMVGYVEQLCNQLNRTRPWVGSPKEFFGSNRAINYLTNLREML